jgi:hypothetical protein
MDSAASKDAIDELFQRNGWELKLPDSPLVLEDDHLRQYRHPTEHPMLVLAIAGIAILAAGLVFYREDRRGCLMPDEIKP